MISPRRRPFRSRCQLFVGDLEIAATTRDVSASGLGVNVPAPELDIVPVTPGTRITACFAVGQRQLSVPCEAAWVSDKSLDVRGEPAVAIGLRFLDPVPEIASFVAHFRHKIVLVSNNLPNVHFLREVVGEDYILHTFMRADEALPALYDEAVSVLVVDTSQNDPSLLKLVRTTAANLPFAHFAILLITDQVNAAQFESLLDLGRALLYLRKPVEAPDVRHTLRLAVEAYAMRTENERLNAELERANSRLEAENEDLRKRVRQVSG